MRRQHEEEIKQLHEIYAVKLLGLNEESLEKQKELAVVKRDVEELEYRIKELLADFEKKEGQSLDSFNERIIIVQKEHQVQIEVLRLESQAEIAEKVQSIESKFEADKAELLAGHKKQIDDLRNFFSVSTVNFKKEAEATRLNDLKQLQLQHDNEIQIWTQNNNEKLLQTIQELTNTKEQEIAELTDEYETKVNNLRLDLAENSGKLLDLTVLLMHEILTAL